MLLDAVSLQLLEEHQVIGVVALGQLDDRAQVGLDGRPEVSCGRLGGEESPSLDELRAKIVGLIVAPATKIAGVLQAPASQLARVFSAYAAKDAA